MAKLSTKEQGMKLAKQLMNSGSRQGPKWATVIKQLGYDPRTPSGLVFNAKGAAAARKNAQGKGLPKPAPAKPAGPTPQQIKAYTDAANAGNKKYVPGKAGVANPTTTPFENADNLMERLGYESGRDLAFAELDSQLGQSKIERDYQLSQTDDAFNKNSAQNTDEMIGRGLFASSVKDAALYDLEATRAVQRSFLNDRFVQQELDAGRKKDMYTGKGGFNERFNNAMDQKKIQNAKDINDERGPWAIAPTAGRWVAGTPPAVSAAKPNPSNAIPSLGQNPRSGTSKQSKPSSYNSGSKKQAATAVYKKVKQPNKKGGIGAR